MTPTELADQLDEDADDIDAAGQRYRPKADQYRTAAAEVIEQAMYRSGLSRPLAEQDAPEVVQALQDAGLLTDGNDE